MKLKNSWNKDGFGYGLKADKNEIAFRKAINKITVIKPKKKKASEEDKK